MGTRDTAAAARTRVVYVAGTGRSGSTLLGNALGSLPGALHAGEVKLALRRGLAEDGFCGCRRPVRECPVWVPALERTFGHVPDATEAAELDRRLTDAVRTRRTAWWLAGRTSPEVEELVDVFGRLLTSLAEVSGAQAVVDSSKLAPFGALVARSPLLDVRAVQLVRDPRAVAWSWQRAQASGQVSGFEEEMERFDPVKSSLMWLESTTSVAWLSARGGRAAHVVRYEDLVEDPESVLSAVAAFAGLPQPAPGSLVSDGALHLAPSHAAAGNPNRVRSGPVRLRRDDEWAERMPAGQRRLVSLITAPRRRAHGY